MRLSGATLSEEEEMVDMPLRRRLLLILPSLVAGLREAQHKQGVVPCEHLTRRELIGEIENKGAWPGEHVLPLNLGRGVSDACAPDAGT